MYIKNWYTATTYSVMMPCVHSTSAPALHFVTTLTSRSVRWNVPPSPVLPTVSAPSVPPARSRNPLPRRSTRRHQSLPLYPCSRTCTSATPRPGSAAILVNTLRSGSPSLRARCTLTTLCAPGTSTVSRSTPQWTLACTIVDNKCLWCTS